MSIGNKLAASQTPSCGWFSHVVAARLYSALAAARRAWIGAKRNALSNASNRGLSSQEGDIDEVVAPAVTLTVAASGISPGEAGIGGIQRSNFAILRRIQKRRTRLEAYRSRAAAGFRNARSGQDRGTERNLLQGGTSLRCGAAGFTQVTACRDFR